MDSSTGDEKSSHNHAAQADLESSSDIAKAGPFKWSTRQIIAAVSLSILWVGESTVKFLHANTLLMASSRLTSPSIFHWRNTVIHGS